MSVFHFRNCFQLFLSFYKTRKLIFPQSLTHSLILIMAHPNGRSLESIFILYKSWYISCTYSYKIIFLPKSGYNQCNFSKNDFKQPQNVDTSCLIKHGGVLYKYVSASIRGALDKKQTINCLLNHGLYGLDFKSREILYRKSTINLIS